MLWLVDRQRIHMEWRAHRGLQGFASSGALNLILIQRVLQIPIQSSLQLAVQALADAAKSTLMQLLHCLFSSTLMQVFYFLLHRPEVRSNRALISCNNQARRYSTHLWLQLLNRRQITLCGQPCNTAYNRAAVASAKGMTTLVRRRRCNLKFTPCLLGDVSRRGR